MNKRLKLYWVTTADHGEDCFIVSSSARKAAIFHEDNEGYDPGEAHAEKILDIPPDIPCQSGDPSDELLISVGASFITVDQSRVIEINGRKFCEGMMDALHKEICDNILEERGQGRPNNTQRTSFSQN